MKTNRNDLCICGSGKKYKNCCEKKRFMKSGKNNYLQLIISGAISCFVIIMIWGVIEFFSKDHPEMEAYKCPNPNCDRIHYRPVSQSN